MFFYFAISLNSKERECTVEVELSKTFTFEAAHRLPKVPPGHKCARLHGHSFRIEVVVRGTVDPETGWLIDYAEIKDAFEPLFKILDHNYLNEIEGLENPTSENLSRWIWERLSTGENNLARYLYRVTVAETCTSVCHYFGA